MTRCVADASVALAWCFADENDEYAESVLASLTGAAVLVPQHWALEMSNGLLVAERRGRITASEFLRLVAFLEGLPIEVDEDTSPRALKETAVLARSNGLTSYDAAYLDLAMRTGYPLATLDSDLRSAATATGVALYAPGNPGTS